MQAIRLFAWVAAQSMEFDLPGFLADQQRFQEQLTESRWSANPMPFVDGLTSAVLQHPYTVLIDPTDSTIFVTSFTLNHVVRLRMTSMKRAQYKVFIKGAELDGPVGMALDDERHLYVASFTNDHILRVDADSGELLGTFGNDAEMDCHEAASHRAVRVAPRCPPALPVGGQGRGCCEALAAPRQGLGRDSAETLAALRQPP